MEYLGRQKRQGPMMVTAYIQGMINMVLLDYDKDFSVKVPPMLLIFLENIGRITLSLI